MVKGKVFCTSHLDNGWFGSKFTVGFNQKVLKIMMSSVGCHEFYVEDRKGCMAFPKKRPIIVNDLFQVVILGMVSGDHDCPVCALRPSARGWMEKLVSVNPSDFNGQILEEVNGVSSVQEVFNHGFHVFIKF